MRYDEPFNYSSNKEEERDWHSALIYTIGALLMLLFGLIGNGVLR